MSDPLTVLNSEWPTAAPHPHLGQCGPSGGTGGTPFSALVPSGQTLLGLRVRHAGMIDAIGLICSGDEDPADVPMHGGPEGETETWLLAPSDEISRLSGTFGRHLDQLTVHTRLGRSYTFGGQGGEQAFRYDLPLGTQLSGLFGAAGQYVDALGVSFALKVEEGKPARVKKAAAPKTAGTKTAGTKAAGTKALASTGKATGTKATGAQTGAKSPGAAVSKAPSSKAPSSKAPSRPKGGSEAS